MTQILRASEADDRLRDLRVIQSFASTLIHYNESIDDILWDLAQQAVAHIGLEDCIIYLVDDADGSLIQTAAFGPKNPRDRDIASRLRLRPGQGIVGACASLGQPVLVPDTRADTRYVRDDLMRLSELSVPIYSDGRVIGVIDSEHSAAGFFTDWHVDMFTTLAAMTASRITSSRLENERLALATRDHLTGLMNRTAFFRRLDAQLARDVASACLILINLDHFSFINQWTGSAGGDDVLRAVALRLQSCSTPDTPIARLGSDEFAMLVPTAPLSPEVSGRMILDRISAPLEGGALDGLRISASAGLADLASAASASDLAGLASLAMREAKRSGRDRLRLHDATLATQKRRDQKLALDLARDLQDHAAGLRAHFQPIVRISDGEVAGAEVLARWRHPELGDVSPAEFVRAAEASGRIHELGRTIARSALRHIGPLSRSVGGLIYNINVSPLQIQRDGFLSELLAMIADSGVPAGDIACEVTETTLLADEERSAAIFGALSERGVRLVLDDFGTGYASLSTLTRFNFAGVKIDRSFVENIATDRRSLAIVRSVVSMSADLGMSCTAEGIETEAQLDVLRHLGCGLGQGWIFAPALPVSGFERYLVQKRQHAA